MGIFSKNMKGRKEEKKEARGKKGRRKEQNREIRKEEKWRPRRKGSRTLTFTPTSNALLLLFNL